MHKINRAKGEPTKDAPLIIPALPNKDWRAAARQRKAGFIPNEAKARAGASQEDLGTRDVINSGPQQSGLITFKRRKLDDDQRDGEDTKMTPVEGSADGTSNVENQEEVLTDEQRAVNALLMAAQRGDGSGSTDDMPLVAIPMPDSGDWRAAKSEAEAYREDVTTRPDSASLNDYKRMPVSQFGTALLMGMGWKPGQGASKTGKGPSEAFIPKARPALLGLGAKPADADIAAAGQSGKAKPDKRYIPVISKERSRPETSDNDSARRNDSPSGSSSRPRDRDRDRDDARDYDRRRDRSKEYSKSSRDRDRDERSERDRDRPDSNREDNRRDDYRRRDRRDDDHSDRDRDRYREKDKDRERERERRKDREMDGGRDDYRKDKDYDRSERRKDERSEDSRRRK